MLLLLDVAVLLWFYSFVFLWTLPDDNNIGLSMPRVTGLCCLVRCCCDACRDMPCRATYPIFRSVCCSRSVVPPIQRLLSRMTMESGISTVNNDCLCTNPKLRNNKKDSRPRNERPRKRGPPTAQWCGEWRVHKHWIALLPSSSSSLSLSLSFSYSLSQTQLPHHDHDHHHHQE